MSCRMINSIDRMGRSVFVFLLLEEDNNTPSRDNESCCWKHFASSVEMGIKWMGLTIPSCQEHVL
jgi:hypothetical protein